MGSSKSGPIEVATRDLNRGFQILPNDNLIGRSALGLKMLPIKLVSFEGIKEKWAATAALYKVSMNFLRLPVQKQFREKCNGRFPWQVMQPSSQQSDVGTAKI